MAQGRCSAMLAVAVLLVSTLAVVQGVTYTVGDGQGWSVPTSATFYADWAANKTFVAGDMLLFVYNKAGHNVLIVSSADYTACTLTSTNKLQTGNDSIALVAGVNSFVCGIPGHCSMGQKVTVTAAAATPGTPNPITPPAPPTTTTPATTPTNAATAGTTVTVLQVLAAVMVSVVASLAL